MIKEDYLNKLNKWKTSHSEEYEDFRTKMNSNNNSGYLMIYELLKTVIPDYEKLILRKLNDGEIGDLSDIRKIIKESYITELLNEDINQLPEDSITPHILCWIFLDNGYERAFERGEKMRKNEELEYYEKQFIFSIEDRIVSNSIKHNIRSQEDWENQFQKMILLDGDTKQISSKFLNQLKVDLPVKAQDKKMTLPENYIHKIEYFIKVKNSGYDLACLKIALEEMSLIKIKDIKNFRDALHDRFGNEIHINVERGIQEQYKILTSTSKNIFVKNTPEDRNYIELIKNIIKN